MENGNGRFGGREVVIVEAVRPGGCVAVLGLFRAPIRLDPYLLFRKELTLAWSNCYERSREGADFATAISIGMVT